MTIFPFGKLVRNVMSEQDEPRAVSESLQHPMVLAGLAPAVLPAVTSSEAMKAQTCGLGPADGCSDADVQSRYSSSILQTPLHWDLLRKMWLVPAGARWSSCGTSCSWRATSERSHLPRLTWPCPERASPASSSHG